MRKLLLLVAVFLFVPEFSAASGSGGMRLINPAIDLNDNVSLQRGARIFMNYCLSCHSAKFMRYNRMGSDIGLTDEQVKMNMMFTTDKVGDVMSVAMSPKDATVWFGSPPPDLSVVSRSRGVDWLYSYMLGFYEDPNPSRPFGVNNMVFQDVAMPHALLELQGVQRKKSLDDAADSYVDRQHVFQEIDSLLELVVQSGSIGADEYRDVVTDLVSFLAYMGEPARLHRQRIGIWVLLFLSDRKSVV